MRLVTMNAQKGAATANVAAPFSAALGCPSEGQVESTNALEGSI
jgi:hypothetical protein